LVACLGYYPRFVTISRDSLITRKTAYQQAETGNNRCSLAQDFLKRSQQCRNYTG
jgi:hypothetical protein